MGAFPVEGEVLPEATLRLPDAIAPAPPVVVYAARADTNPACTGEARVVIVNHPPKELASAAGLPLAFRVRGAVHPPSKVDADGTFPLDLTAPVSVTMPIDPAKAEPADAAVFRLEVECAALEWAAGATPPVDVAGRCLVALGYAVSTPPREDEIVAFQYDQSIRPTGTLDPVTRIEIGVIYRAFVDLHPFAKAPKP